MTITTTDLIRTIDEARVLFENRSQELIDRAQLYFRDYKPEARDEAVANTLFFTWEDFARLINRALANDTLLTTTFCFACRRTRSGRMVQAEKHSGKKELWTHSRPDNSLDMDAFIRDQTPVFDAVCFKLDTQSWLDSLPDSDRSYAVEMADGSTTNEIAQRHNVSAPAVSMRRAKIKTSYQTFMQGDEH